LIKQYHVKRENAPLLEDLLDMLLKVCDAVAYAHSANVLHLDIKPDNIHVGAFGEVFLIDWGLAKILTGSADEELYDIELPVDCNTLNDMTLVGTLKGSPGFMAPEQAGGPGEKSFATDIYALGALLYTILTGVKHVQGATAEERLVNTRNGEWLSPTKRFPDKNIPASLEAVCMKALSVQAEERYDSAGEFRSEIQAYLRGFATEAEDAGFIKQIRLLYTRNKFRCNMALCFMLVMVGGTAWFVKALHQREQLADKERKAAIVAKHEAENSLKMYLKEKQSRERMTEQMGTAITGFEKHMKGYKKLDTHFTKLLVSTSIGEERKFDFEAAMAMVDLALKKNPNDDDALAQKGHLHMIKQEFTAALNCFWECYSGAPYVHELERLIRPYWEIKKDDSKRLPLKTLMELIRTLPKGRNWLKLYFLVHDHQVNPSLTDHSKMVKEYIVNINPVGQSNSFDFVFEQREDGNHLSMTNNKKLVRVSTFAGPSFPYKSLLATLGLRSLDISNTGFVEIEPLAELPIEELNISGTPIESLTFLTHAKPAKLKTIYVNRGQIKSGLKVAQNNGISVIDENGKLITSLK